jgi:hypothetical protein
LPDGGRVWIFVEFCIGIASHERHEINAKLLLLKTDIIRKV